MATARLPMTELRVGVALALLGIFGGWTAADIGLGLGIGEVLSGGLAVEGWRFQAIAFGGAIGAVGGILGLIDTRPTLLMTLAATGLVISTGEIDALIPGLWFGSAVVVSWRHLPMGTRGRIDATKDTLSIFTKAMLVLLLFGIIVVTLMSVLGAITGYEIFGS